VGSVPDARTSRSGKDLFGLGGAHEGAGAGESEGSGPGAVELDSLVCEGGGAEAPRVQARGRMHRAVLRRQAKAKKRFASLRE